MVGFRVMSRALLAAIIITILAATVAPAAPKRVQILFRQAWLPDDIYVPYMVAKDLGYYEEVGIDFVNQVGAGTGVSTKVVGAGTSQLGKGEAAGVIQAVQQGVPIKAVMLEFQETPTSVVVLADSPIQTLKDLEGKKIATQFDTAAHVLLVAGLKLAGVDTTKINFVNLSPAQWNTALIAGDVAGINAYFSNQPVDLEARGARLRVFRMKDVGLRVPSQTIFVNNTFLARNPQVVSNFLAATIRGYKYTMAFPTRAVRMMTKYYPDFDPDIILKKLQLDFEVYQTPETAAQGFGWNDARRWEGLQQIMLDAGLVKSKMPVETYFTNDVLAKVPMEIRQLKR